MLKVGVWKVQEGCSKQVTLYFVHEGALAFCPLKDLVETVLRVDDQYSEVSRTLL